ncbi:MAG: AAA family ATPase [Thermoplasmata archaeon]|nr:AAA family ATPase [Thermoplasmata archaeon]
MNMDDRIPTYIKGLDERMEGGIPKRYIVLVCGHAGTMKSSFTYSVLYHSAKKGMKGMYITLEQSRESLLEHMQKLGFTDYVSENLIVVDLAKVRKDMGVQQGEQKEIDWLGSLINALKAYKNMFGCEIMVLDSLAALYSLTDFKNPRSDLFSFFEKVRDLGLTALLISEMPTDKQVFGLYGIEDFLSDGIIHLATEKSGNSVNLFLGVVKMRKTNHDRGYFPLIFDNGVFEIVTD